MMYKLSNWNDELVNSAKINLEPKKNLHLKLSEDFPGNLVVKTLRFYRRGTKISYAAWHGHKIKNK